jgi:hypothetical protein
MILIATSATSCAAAFKAYQRVLRALRLPVHPPVPVTKYGVGFWQGKSKAPYDWSAKRVPWIQFVGYQIRHEGLLRIRPSSLKKQLTAVTKATDRLLNTLQRAQRHKAIRRTEHEIQHRLRQKLISMSVGRITLGTKYVGPRPMCWAAGFRGLTAQKLCQNQLKRLDRHRERQLQRTKRYLRKIHLSQTASSRKKTDVHKYYGRPYSYVAQFR